MVCSLSTPLNSYPRSPSLVTHIGTQTFLLYLENPSLLPPQAVCNWCPFCAVFFPYPRPSPSAHSDFSLISPPQRDLSSPAAENHLPFTLLYFLPECSLLSEMLSFTSCSFLLEHKSQALMDLFCLCSPVISSIRNGIWHKIGAP